MVDAMARLFRATASLSFAHSMPICNIVVVAAAVLSIASAGLPPSLGFDLGPAAMGPPGAIRPGGPPPFVDGPVPRPTGPEEVIVEGPNQFRHSIKHDVKASKREETVFDGDERFPTTTVTVDDDYGTAVYKKPFMRPGLGAGMGMGGFGPGPGGSEFFPYSMGSGIARPHAAPGWGPHHHHHPHQLPLRSNTFF